MSSQTVPPKDSGSPGIPSQGVRTLITLLLFFTSLRFLPASLAILEPEAD